MNPVFLFADQFTAANKTEVDNFRTKIASGFPPIHKDCEGAEAVILFVTTDDEKGERVYTLRAAVQTKGGIVWTMPDGYEIGSMRTRKACSHNYKKLQAPELYYGWESGRLFPKFDFSRNEIAKEPKEIAPEAPKNKGGRPRNIKKTFSWGSYDVKSDIKIGGLTPGVDIDWPHFLNTRKVRMPREPDATIERLNEERPETEKLRRIRLKALHKEGHIENPSEYGAYLDPVTDEEFEASMIEVEERLRKEGMEREIKAPRITPNHPAGASLIRMATIKIQDGTFKYIGEVMEYLDRMGLQDFTEAQMLEVLDAKGIRIER